VQIFFKEQFHANQKEMGKHFYKLHVFQLINYYTDIDVSCI